MNTLRIKDWYMKLGNSNRIEFTKNFQEFVDELFGLNGKDCLMRTCTDEDSDFLEDICKLFFEHLVMNKKHQSIYNFPVNCLPQITLKVIQSGNYSKLSPFMARIVTLQGGKPRVQLNMMEYYLFAFAHFLVANQINVGHQAQRATTFHEQMFYHVYMRLLRDHLMFFLPLPNTFMNESYPHEDVTFLHTDDSELQHFFVQVLIEFWLQPNEGIMRHGSPKIELLFGLTQFVKHLNYILFNSGDVNNVPGMTDRVDLRFPAGGSMGKYCCTWIYGKHSNCFHCSLMGPLYNFLTLAFQKWPHDSSFRYLYSLWISYITPWKHGTSEHLICNVASNDYEEIFNLEMPEPEALSGYQKYFRLSFMVDNFPFYSSFITSVFQRTSWHLAQHNSLLFSLVLLRDLTSLLTEEGFMTLFFEVEKEIFSVDGATYNNNVEYYREAYNTKVDFFQLREANFEAVKQMTLANLREIFQGFSRDIVQIEANSWGTYCLNKAPLILKGFLQHMVTLKSVQLIMRKQSVIKEIMLDLSEIFQFGCPDFTTSTLSHEPLYQKSSFADSYAETPLNPNRRCNSNNFHRRQAPVQEKRQQRSQWSISPAPELNNSRQNSIERKRTYSERPPRYSDNPLVYTYELKWMIRFLRFLSQRFHLASLRFCEKVDYFTPWEAQEIFCYLRWLANYYVLSSLLVTIILLYAFF